MSSASLFLFFALLFASSGDVRAEPSVPRRWLALGDSHSVGVFGQAWVDELQRALPGLSLAVRARCGAVPNTFLRHPTPWNCGAYDRDPNGDTRGPIWERTPVELLPDLLDRFVPEIVSVQLGGNLLGAAEEMWREQLEELLGKFASLGSHRCFWIGPPPGWARDPEVFERFYVVLNETVGRRCQVLDSRRWVEYPTGAGDGVHLDSLTPAELRARFGCPLSGDPSRSECLTGQARARLWARGVVSTLQRALAPR